MASGINASFATSILSSTTSLELWGCGPAANCEALALWSQQTALVAPSNAAGQHDSIEGRDRSGCPDWLHAGLPGRSRRVRRRAANTATQPPVQLPHDKPKKLLKV